MMSNIAIFENIAGMSMFGGNVKIITIYYIIQSELAARRVAAARSSHIGHTFFIVLGAVLPQLP